MHYKTMSSGTVGQDGQCGAIKAQQALAADEMVDGGKCLVLCGRSQFLQEGPALQSFHLNDKIRHLNINRLYIYIENINKTRLT